MVEIDFKSVFEKILVEQNVDYKICGLISIGKNIYPLDSDTKVLSAVFEMFTRPIILGIAKENNLKVAEPISQNYYPDFTLMDDENDKKKIAIDVKTTYIEKDNASFRFLLGGYTSCIRGEGTKNIIFPFGEYSEHWIVGYVYKRSARKRKNKLEKETAKYRVHTVDKSDSIVYPIDQLSKIELPYENVQIIVQEKWRISSDKAGSGNTTSIKSTNGRLKNFTDGNTPFESEEEFLEYWRNYEKTKSLRKEKFKDIHEFREWKKSQK